MTTLLRNRNFLLHWAGGAIAQTGNFFTYVALPWLVLLMTDNDPVVMASVMATLHLPQSLLLLVGGALVDMVSPLRAIIVCRFAAAVVLLGLATQVYLEQIQLPGIYVYALILGMLGAVNLPANQALLPGIVLPKWLGAANGITMGTLHVAQILGPILAGLTIWLAREIRQVPAGTSDFSSLSFAFYADCLAMVAALAFTVRISVASPIRLLPINQLLPYVFAGIRTCWSDQGIRLVLSYVLLISFFLHGSLLAGLPLLAKSKYLLSEGAFGGLYAMTGLGVVIGAGIALKLAPTAAALGTLVLVCDLIAGAMLSALGIAANPFIAGCLLLMLGACSGVIMIAGTTWFQLRTAGEYMGRVMSVLMFCIFGLIPVSALISGWIIAHFSVDLLFQGSGLIMLFIAVAGLMTPYIRNMGALPPPASAALN